MDFKVSDRDSIRICLICCWVDNYELAPSNVIIFKRIRLKLAEIHKIVKACVLVIKYFRVENLRMARVSITKILSEKLFNRLQIFPKRRAIFQDSPTNKFRPVLILLKFLEQAVGSRIHVSNE
ncbi:hypothetical protein D3C72_2103020 [compost metagenome]